MTRAMGLASVLAAASLLCGAACRGGGDRNPPAPVPMDRSAPTALLGPETSGSAAESPAAPGGTVTAVYPLDPEVRAVVCLAWLDNEHLFVITWRDDEEQLVLFPPCRPAPLPWRTRRDEAWRRNPEHYIQHPIYDGTWLWLWGGDIGARSVWKVRLADGDLEWTEATCEGLDEWERSPRSAWPQSRMWHGLYVHDGVARTLPMPPSADPRDPGKTGEVTTCVSERGTWTATHFAAGVRADCAVVRRSESAGGPPVEARFDSGVERVYFERLFESPDGRAVAFLGAGQYSSGAPHFVVDDKVWRRDDWLAIAPWELTALAGCHISSIAWIRNLAVFTLSMWNRHLPSGTPGRFRDALVAVDLATGKMSQPAWGALALRPCNSPDGRELAFVRYEETAPEKFRSKELVVVEFP